MSPSIPRAILTIVAALLIALSALYLTILFHELGHAGAAFALGCDDAFSRLTVKMSVVGPSFGVAIDEACLARAPRWSLAAVGIAGVIVNLCLMFASWGAGRAVSRPALASVWLQAFAAANFVEAFSQYCPAPHRHDPSPAVHWHSEPRGRRRLRRGRGRDRRSALSTPSDRQRTSGASRARAVADRHPLDPHGRRHGRRAPQGGRLS